MPAQNAHSESAHLWVAAGQLLGDEIAPRAADSIENPQRPRLEIWFCFVGNNCDERRDALFFLCEQPFSRQKLRCQIGTFQTLDGVIDILVRPRLFTAYGRFALRSNLKNAPLI